MIKKELLSPVGNLESLYEAIHNGADAVYLGGKKFGARAFADNFDEQELIKAIKYCHLYEVKIYVTINTIIYENELSECLNYIRFLHQNNVDAVIMQDLGLIKLTREKFPNLEIHASTQMHNHNQEQLKMLENLGIKRVVLAREIPIEEINEYETNMEIEAFIHGALCISYSGQCLFSSLLLNRSGNRGSCAGICRLPFKLIEDTHKIDTEGDYLLSPKEFMTLNNFQEIMESNIYSLKIEGRMKSPAYVGFITKLYRTLIDNYNNNKSLEISNLDLDNLKVLFNRGFTKGHLFKEQTNNLMNIKNPNHQGIILGKVIEIKKDKIKIKLEKDIHQEDGIRFYKEGKGFIVNFLYNEQGLLINKALAGSVIYVDNKINLQNKDIVLKTIDYELTKELEKINYKKIPLICTLKAFINKPLEISFSDNKNDVFIKGNIIEEAKNNETTKDIIEDKLKRLGDCPFIIKEFHVEKDDNIFIPMSELKNIKRDLIEKLINIRENFIPHVFVENNISENKTSQKTSYKINLNVLVRNEEQLKYCLSKNIKNIYVTDENLYKKYQDKENVYLRLSRVKSKFKELNERNLLVCETGSLFKYGKNNNVIADYYFNVVNSKCFNYLENLGANLITLSVENNIENLKNLCENIENKEKIELFIYGKPEVMVMKYCPLNMLVNKNNFCNVCKNNHKYYLKDRNDQLYRIINEAEDNHLTHIMYYKNLDLISNIDEYKKMGIENYRIELLDETPDEIELILCKIS